jgi:outer membrane protein TolC
VIDVTRRAAEVARAHYEFAHERRRGGVGNAVDEVRAEQQLATADAQLETALTQLVRSQEALGTAVGEDGPLDSAADPDLAPPQERPEDALRDATAVRADVRAARDRAEAARRVARDSWADWLPSVLGTATPFRQHPPTLTTPETGWQAQIVLSLPVFEGGLKIGQRKERNALSDEARDQLDGLLRQARSEVRAAFASLEHAEVALDRSRVAAARADTALDLVTEAYKAGATTSLDVIDATQRASDANTAAVVAEDAVRQSRLDLLAATGRFP